MKRVPHAIRKYLSIALLFVLFTALFGCSVKRNDLIPDKEISRIKVQIYPFHRPHVCEQNCEIFFGTESDKRL